VGQSTKRLAIFAAGLLTLASAARAETLVVPPYPDAAPWKQITDQHNAQQLLREWIPADQSVDAIKDILTEQAFYNLKGEDPNLFVASLLRRIGAACAGVRVNGPVPGSENGYPVAYAQAYCVGQKGAGLDVDIFLKAIGGKEALYVAQREFHRPTKPGETAGVAVFSKDQLGEMKARLAAQSAANQYLESQVQLCPPAGGGACATEPGNGPQAAPAEPSITEAAAKPASGGEDSIPPFVNGVYTAKDVVKVLGQPSSQNHSPDGRFAYMYQGKDGSTAAFLFDKKGVLIRARTYAKSQ